MRLLGFAWLVMWATAAAAGGTEAPPPRSVTGIEVVVETVMSTADGFDAPCQVELIKDASSDRLYSAWSSWAAPAAAGSTGKAGTTPARLPVGKCGAGKMPAASSTPSSDPAPLMTQEVTAIVTWNAGAMDPGPQNAMELFLETSTREQTAASEPGHPMYGAPTVDRRVIRVEPGEEYLVPVTVKPSVRDGLGVSQALVRVRAGWAVRPQATRYGTLAIDDAKPGSMVKLDGGVAGQADKAGKLVLTNVPIGLRTVRIDTPSGASASRVVEVLEGRAVPIAVTATDIGTTAHRDLKATDKNPQGFQEYRRARDEVVLIQIPEGEYSMGNLETEGAPQPHTVFVSTFLFDKLPLTVERYRRFAAATGRPLPPDPWWGVHDDFPVAFTRWDEARAYCEWVGGRLPTEAEREKAGRGTDGRMFPWGNDPPSDELAVFGHHWGDLGNDTAGARPKGASPYGVLDPEGNMWEDCEDWWDPDYYAVSPKKDPKGPKTGTAQVVRGGSWDSRWVALSAAKRNFAFTGYREGDFGFRCASDPPR